MSEINALSGTLVVKVSVVVELTVSVVVSVSTLVPESLVMMATLTGGAVVLDDDDDELEGSEVVELVTEEPSEPDELLRAADDVKLELEDEEGVELDDDVDVEVLAGSDDVEDDAAGGEMLEDDVTTFSADDELVNGITEDWSEYVLVTVVVLTNVYDPLVDVNSSVAVYGF